MNLHACLATNNRCYQKGVKIKPKGIMVHSTAANNPYLSRYVGPDDGLLGPNKYGNTWNNPNLSVCVHAFIGKLKDGTIATYQTLPWDYRAWHAMSGPKGSANDTHISFEICEDNLLDPSYFNAVYQEAVELCAYLCKVFGFNPLADIICHKEGFEAGIASHHGDVLHWFPKHGRTMNNFRADVVKQLSKKEAEKSVLYETLLDVPESYRPTIKKLMEKGGLSGYKDPDPARIDDNIINIDETYCRVMTTLDKMGKL